MFEKNKQLQKAINNLYNFLKKEEYGSKYSWAKLKEISGVTKDEHIYYVANRVCLMLMRNDQKFLETERTYGKRIVNPSEHGLIAKKTANKSVKIYRKAGAVLASTNMEELSEDQKKDVIDAANKYNTLEMFANEMFKKKQIGNASKSDVKTAGLFLDAIKLFSGN